MEKKIIKNETLQNNNGKGIAATAAATADKQQ